MVDAFSDVKALTILDDVIIVPFAGWGGHGGGFDASVTIRAMTSSFTGGRSQGTFCAHSRTTRSTGVTTGRSRGSTRQTWAIRWRSRR